MKFRVFDKRYEELLETKDDIRYEFAICMDGSLIYTKVADSINDINGLKLSESYKLSQKDYVISSYSEEYKCYEGDIRSGEYCCCNDLVVFKEILRYDYKKNYFYWESINGRKPDFIETKIIGNHYKNKELL